MNKNLNLVEILKDCPRGTKLYSTIFGEVEFESIHNSSCSIKYKTITGRSFDVTCEGKMFADYDGECTLYPSKDQRDWSKFKLKKERFDPKTLKPFDKILVRRGNENYDVWFPDFVSDPPDDTINKTFCMCIMENILMAIPYNDDTKHLVGTSDKAPEFYRYWED